jgi:hypothetical protein
LSQIGGEARDKASGVEGLKLFKCVRKVEQVAALVALQKRP